MSLIFLNSVHFTCLHGHLISATCSAQLQADELKSRLADALQVCTQVQAVNLTLRTESGVRSGVAGPFMWHIKGVATPD